MVNPWLMQCFVTLITWSWPILAVDRYAKEDARYDAQKMERKAKNDERRSERKERLDEIRRKYGEPLRVKEDSQMQWSGERLDQLSHNLNLVLQEAHLLCCQKLGPRPFRVLLLQSPVRVWWTLGVEKKCFWKIFILACIRLSVWFSVSLNRKCFCKQIYDIFPVSEVKVLGKPHLTVVLFCHHFQVWWRTNHTSVSTLEKIVAAWSTTSRGFHHLRWHAILLW